MQITSYLHTAILVADLERAKQFYGGVLGLKEVARSLKFPGVWYQLGDYQIHLMVQAQYQYLLTSEQKWGRNAHIALSVDDVAEAQAELTAAGYNIRLSSSGRKALFVRDPDGNVLELSQIEI
ncbi:MAG: glyoxalase [Spirulina sp. SIO3F2]|nr:glyoxalase [Spirulina sp. SIO3F2]